MRIANIEFIFLFIKVIKIFISRKSICNAGIHWEKPCLFKPCSSYSRYVPRYLSRQEECPSKKLRINILKCDQQNSRHDAKKIMLNFLKSIKTSKDMISKLFSPWILPKTHQQLKNQEYLKYFTKYWKYFNVFVTYLLGWTYFDLPLIFTSLNQNKKVRTVSN